MSGDGEAIRILGIDPGSRITGWGIIELERGQTRHLISGCARLVASEMAPRLGDLFRTLQGVIECHRPQEMAVEQVFFHRNPDSALKLGQARGVAICAGVVAGLAVAEYSARQIKQAVVGTGGAEKPQVQHMVRTLLALPEAPQADRADALAVALCHAHSRQTLERLAIDGERARRLRSSDGELLSREELFRRYGRIGRRRR